MARKKNPRTEIVKAIRDAKEWITAGTREIYLNSGKILYEWGQRDENGNTVKRERRPEEYIENNRAELNRLYNFLHAAELDLARARRLVHQRMLELEAGR